MAKNVRLPAPKHLQSIIELRYPRAHRYWDDCGKLIELVETAFPGLVCQGLEQHGFRFEGLSGGITGVVFYWDRASLTQTGQGDAGLARGAARFWELVREVLQPKPPTRIGHRTWMCYETDRTAEADRWLREHSLWTLDEGAAGLGQPFLGATVIRTKLDAGGRRVRFETNSGTMTVKGDTTRNYHGVILDVDITVENPESEVADDLAEYISWNLSFLRTTVDPIFRR